MKHLYTSYFIRNKSNIKEKCCLQKYFCMSMLEIDIIKSVLSHVKHFFKEAYKSSKNRSVNISIEIFYNKIWLVLTIYVQYCSNIY